MSMLYLNGDIDSATVYTTDVRDRRLRQTFPIIAEGWNEALQDYVATETDASLRVFEIPRPDQDLIAKLHAIEPSLVTVVSETEDDPQILQEYNNMRRISS